MGTLTQCIRRAGKALDAEDANQIQQLRDQLKSEGLTEAEAAKEAVAAQITDVLRERDELLSGTPVSPEALPAPQNHREYEIGISAAEKRAGYTQNDADDPDEEGAQGGRSYALEVERESRERYKRARLSPEEDATLEKTAPPEMLDELRQSAARTKALYPKKAGWAPLELAGYDRKAKKLKWRATPYGFSTPPGAKRAPSKIDAPWMNKVAGKFVAMIEDIYQRADAGDKNAQVIIAHQTWYRNVTEALRREFGGQADLLADLLGATSPNEAVAKNWEYSIEILRRFWRGEFDAEMRAFADHLEAGKPPSKFPASKKIRKATGALYGMNSTNAMQALFNTWRQIRPEQAPKARNFALNLIGQSNMATIDVWAARMLRRAANSVPGANLPRIPPPAEQGVSGTWRADMSSVGGEFGFGAAVMEEASRRLADAGINLTPPDLQAVAWFAEKELWSKKNWTTKSGEGGSFEEQLEGQPMERYIAGWSIQNGEVTPSADEVNAASARVLAMLAGDESVVVARVAPTLGLYAGAQEVSFDTEWSAERGKHDPSMVVAELAKIAQENDQTDVFVSRVIPPEEDNPNARPGMEIYFQTERALEAAQPVLDELVSGGTDGFTMVVDPRSEDENTFIGVRLQYVPEIEIRYNEGLRAQMLEEGGLEAAFELAEERLLDATETIMAMDGVAYAAVARYDTIVFGQENYDGYIDRVSGAADQDGRGEAWFGQPALEGLERAAARYEGEPVEVNEGDVLYGDESDPVGDPYDDLQTRPDTSEQQRTAGRSALRDLLRRLDRIVEGRRDRGEARPRTTLLASRIAAGFRAGEPQQLVGQKASTGEDLAALAQVYRDPRFETFRVIFTKGDEVVGENSITSRLPAAVSFGSAERYFGTLRKQMEALGADGYYMLHNHPSGRSRPSPADVRLTKRMAEEVPGFRQHVVIDFNEYSTLDADGQGETVSADFGATDFFGNPEVDHEVLGWKITSPVEGSRVARALADSERPVVVVTSARGEVQVVTSIDPEVLELIDDGEGRGARARATLRAMLRESGAGGYMFLIMPESFEGRRLALGDFGGDLFMEVYRADGSSIPSLDTGNDVQRTLHRHASIIEDRLAGMPEYVEVDGKRVKFENFEPAQSAARKYAEKAGIEYNEPTEYAELDRARARKIAREFELMQHAPNDPEVKAAYQAMIDETLAQYEAIMDTGLTVRFIKGADPYGNPRNAVLDVVENNHLFVFSTRDGFGSDASFDASENPLLQETAFKTADGEPMLANDVFRVVHDYFGHIKNGVGFRARGEENAWQAHAAMYSPLARRAMTTETRGQNSWVNFGPHAEANQTASGADTVYADQKIGLLPIWVSEEGRLSDRLRRDRQEYRAGLEGAIVEGRLQLSHFSRGKVERTEPARAGTGLDRKVGGRRFLPQATYFGITQADEDGYRREAGLGQVESRFSIEPELLYPLDANPLNLKGSYPELIEQMQEAGFSGLHRNHPQLGKVAVVWDSLISDDAAVSEERANYGRTPAYWSAEIPADAKQEIADEGLPLFRAGDGGRGMPTAKVREVIDGMPPEMSERVHVVQSVNELGPEIRAEMARQGVDSIDGYYNRRTQEVWLVADSLRNPRHVQRTLLHETIGHRGIERVMGPQFREFLAMVEGARGTDRLIDQAYEHVEKYYADASDFVKAAEVVARISESDPKHNLVQRALQWMREALRRMGFNVMFTSDDIIEALRRAKQAEMFQSPDTKGLLSNTGDPLFKAAKRGYAPKKTVKAYKLFNYRDGQLYPLFVGADQPVPIGEWLEAEMGEGYKFQMPNGQWYVPAKTGGSLKPGPEVMRELYERGFTSSPDNKTIKAVALRPGWHAGDAPMSTHLGKKDPDMPPVEGAGSSVNYRPTEQVWAEVEMPADVDWQAEATRRAGTTKDGRLKVSEAHITDEVPLGGHYRYKTNPNMTGNWLVSGHMKVNRILPHTEVERINEARGVADLPRRPQDTILFSAGDTGSNVTSLADARANVDMKKFRKSMMEKLREGAKKRVAAVMAMDAAGGYADFAVGDRFRTTNKKGFTNVYTVIGKTVSKPLAHLDTPKGMIAELDGKPVTAFLYVKSADGTQSMLQVSGLLGREDVVKMTGPRGMFRYSGGDTSNFAIPDETWVDLAIRKMQDKFIPLKRLQQAIQEAGGVVDESNDAYLAEELFHSKAENDLRKVSDRYIDPLAKKMAEFGITHAELDEYLYAMHAPERNRHIASINERRPEGGSGMTDLEAGRILARIERDGKTAQMKELSQYVYDMIQLQREMVLEGSLEDDGTVAAWQSKYKHYVPLKGWAEDTKAQGRPGAGGGFSIRGKESKRAAAGPARRPAPCPTPSWI
jgi:hypothetical protein